MQIKMFFATVIVGVQLVVATVSMARQSSAVPNTDNQSKTNARVTSNSTQKSKVKKVAMGAENGTKEGARKVGQGGERAGEAVAKGSEKAADGTVVGLKDTGRVTAKGAEKAEKATVGGVRKVGRLFKKSGRK